MPRLTELSYQDIVRRLKKCGFRFYRQGKGSHELWVRDEDGKAIPVPHYRGKTIRKGTVKAIIKEIGVSVDMFMKL
ncbi:MAG: type II toxin-antitoxin system HicA family toxin [Ignavibacteriales bacterium]|nr:type II toxin-antitoxin system HicA family toxin [Ignavibacteriales bacterium]